jgi:hypothetical protein
MRQPDEAGADPLPLDELPLQVRDKETAEEFCLAFRMALDRTTDPHRACLACLRERLGVTKLRRRTLSSSHFRVIGSPGRTTTIRAAHGCTTEDVAPADL